MASDKQRSKAEPPPKAETAGALDLGKVPLEIPDDGIFEAYSNVVNMNWTLYDVRIRFQELIQVPDDSRWPTWENQQEYSWNGQQSPCRGTKRRTFAISWVASSRTTKR